MKNEPIYMLHYSAIFFTHVLLIGLNRVTTEDAHEAIENSAAWQFICRESTGQSYLQIVLQLHIPHLEAISWCAECTTSKSSNHIPLKCSAFRNCKRVSNIYGK